jgi:hypothetical protein
LDSRGQERSFHLGCDACTRTKWADAALFAKTGADHDLFKALRMELKSVTRLCSSAITIAIPPSMPKRGECSDFHGAVPEILEPGRGRRLVQGGSLCDVFGDEQHLPINIVFLRATQFEMPPVLVGPPNEYPIEELTLRAHCILLLSNTGPKRRKMAPRLI